MATIKQIKDKVDLARNGIDNATSSIIQENEEKILNYIRNDQLFQGKDSDGKAITSGSKYTGVYARTYDDDSVGGSTDYAKPITKKIGGKPYNFTWSGETMKGFLTQYSNFSLEIINTGSRSNYLKGFYDNGDKLFQMSEENEKKLSSEIIRPNLVKYFKTFFK